MRGKTVFLNEICLKIVLIGSLYWICKAKKYALPIRTFENSNKNIPDGNSVNQVANLPVPFPIREPFIFLLNGK